MLRVRRGRRRPSLTLRRDLAALVVLALAAGCSWFGSDDPPPTDESTIGSDQCARNELEPPVPLPDFYDIGCPLVTASHPGKVMKAEPLAERPPGASAWRILYRSTTAQGAPTAVSGIVVAPASAPPPGGFPVVGFAHPTTGVARLCAPSLAPDWWNGDVRSPTTYELVQPLVEAGYAVVATDYRGLGTPGPHPYLVGEEESRNVLDSIRAIRELPEVEVSDTTFLYGHSQGGQAVAFAAETGGEYAPDVVLGGVVEVAPAAELAELLEGEYEAAPPFGPALRMTLIAAWSAFYEEARADQVVTPAAEADLSLVFEQCLSRAGTALASTTTPEDFTVALTSQPTWRRLLEVNTPGGTGSDVPVLVVQGGLDQIVRPPATRRFVARLCRVDQPVELRLFRDETHESILPASMAAVVGWMAERRADLPVTGRC